ncbi:MAG: hypothetical protein DRI65_08495 [Chloroflexota bacterium]|nr:MAG: hypothetical protein DRI65_08495 [Chloroflexota bacterium]
MKPTQIGKPQLKAAEALAFASEGDKTEKTTKTTKLPKTKAQKARAKKRVFHAPEGDKRLTINIKEDLHKKLKIAAINNDMTAGELIEALIEKHLK